MHIVHTRAQLREALQDATQPAFVPTMGNLHAGHLSLVARAKQLGDCTVASVFVNRLQFLPHEDFNSYPRTFEDDCQALRAAGCDVLFAPDEQEMYPQAQTFRVLPDPALADILEGQFRPGFFTGVCTVVLKLFQAVFAGKAHGHAVFGKKDYQQQLIIAQMIKQFNLPITLLGLDTARAPDGLALSSRNRYLSEAERTQASALYRALTELATNARPALNKPNPHALADLEQAACQRLQQAGWAVDYLTVRRQDNLQTPSQSDADAPLLALGAARLGQTRLIDNVGV
jgi:pantoate--beta-alanine ligase